MKILIIDDDVSFYHDIRLHFKEDDFKFINEVDSESAIKRISEEKLDLVILDCVLWNDRFAGLKIAPLLSKMSMPFIFITGYHSEDTFEEMLKFNPITYFQKPVDLVTLSFHIHKFHKNIFQKGGDHISAQSGNIFIKQSSKVYNLAFDQVKYIEVEGNYLTFHDTQDKKYVVKMSLSKFLRENKSILLERVHRNFLVNPTFVDRFDFQSNELVIKDVSIPFSRSYKQNVKKMINSKSI